MEQYDSENAIDLQACFFKHGRFIERSLPPWFAPPRLNNHGGAPGVGDSSASAC